jgi:transcription elongation factor Elf1
VELEHFFQCPYCWEEISMILDASVPQQIYIEDCEVCCNPIEISPFFERGELIGFRSESLEQ